MKAFIYVGGKIDTNYITEQTIDDSAGQPVNDTAG